MKPLERLKFRGVPLDEPKTVFVGNALSQDTKNGVTRVFLHNETSGWVQVKPETVGQYIGKQDKTGRDVFDGDIVDITSPMVTVATGRPTGEAKTTIERVGWHDKNACWCLYKSTSDEHTGIASVHGIETYGTVIGHISKHAHLLKQKRG